MNTIVGHGGIGKSTLAKKVFASEAIKEEFKIKIWLSVAQQFTTVDLLRTAIAHAGGEHCEDKDKTLLVQALTDALSKKKFLLVLDDVWNKEAWDRVLRVPVLNAGTTQPGSGVLVTTRMEGVARSMGASILRVNQLGDEDAWCLLKKQLPQPQVSSSSIRILLPLYKQVQYFGHHLVKLYLAVLVAHFGWMYDNHMCTFVYQFYYILQFI